MTRSGGNVAMCGKVRTAAVGQVGGGALQRSTHTGASGHIASGHGGRVLPVATRRQ